MQGGGPFNLKVGSFTDDHSMALCLAASLIDRQKFNPHDQMRRYIMWREQGYMSSIGRCFDIGGTVSSALSYFRRTGDPFAGPASRNTAGNGSLMRLAPVPMFFAGRPEIVPHYCGLMSRTTHGAPQAVDSCRFYGALLTAVLNGVSNVKAWAEMLTERMSLDNEVMEAVLEVPYGPRAEVQSSGYVIHSLGAALWCFYNSDNYRDCVLLAANLGGDSDTTAAIAGQLAGAYYGLRGIPEAWVSKLTMRIETQLMADELHRLAIRKGEESAERAYSATKKLSLVPSRVILGIGK
jgi:ADP-ribosyl-[dinitrogen reductase] hydrolase